MALSRNAILLTATTALAAAGVIAVAVKFASPPTAPAAAVPAKPATNPAPGPAPEGMVWIPGGQFAMGESEASAGLCGDPEAPPDATPIHQVVVDGYWMDTTEVTNAQFAKFIAATNYKTVAEQPLNPAEFPGVDPKLLQPGGNVFTPVSTPVPLDNPLRWWRYQAGADWKHPTGPGSNIDGKDNYPVVQVAYDDAVAYAKWAGKRLPTEAEWEFAARGGLAGKAFPWGDESPGPENYRANLYQGKFPCPDSGADGFLGAGPVKQFAPNGYGLYDIAGNAWEWCADWYRPDTYAKQAMQPITRNPQGPDNGYDPDDPQIPKRVNRGGSFLCTVQYCSRYRVGSRGKAEPNSVSMHIGFRCVKPS